jgi:hypothetical protein
MRVCALLDADGRDSKQSVGSSAQEAHDFSAFVFQKPSAFRIGKLCDLALSAERRAGKHARYLLNRFEENSR